VPLEWVRQWPEVAIGAGGYEMWLFEDFDTGGLRLRLAPEGLEWLTDDDWEPSAPYGDLIERIGRSPDAGHGVVLEADRIDESRGWFYQYYSMPGARLTIPWRAEELELRGEVQVEFALDEVLPQRPLWTRIPRMGGGQSVMLAASPELSLAWKLLWLVRDWKVSGSSRGKDLYDAVLLAELPGLGQVARLAGLDMAALSRADLADVPIDWEAFTAQYPQVEGSQAEWTRRLADALALA
jgi:hypothetical protein